MRVHLLTPWLVACLGPVVRGEVFDLANLSWTLKNANGSIAIPATVPSQAHLDLLRAGIITEPLLGINGESAALIYLMLLNWPQISPKDG